MKTTFINFLRLVFTALPLAAFPQQDVPENLKAYPPPVILKVYQIGSKAKLSKQQQLSLAQQFNRQDSLTVIALQKDLQTFSMDNRRKEEERILTAVLSPLQLIDYKEASSVYASALKYREALALKPEQITELLEKHRQASLNQNPDAAKKTKMEFKQLYKLLGEKQCEKYFTENSRSKAAAAAAQHLAAIKAAGIASPTDAQAQLETYFFNRSYKVDMAMFGPGSVNIDSVRRSIEAAKPMILRKLHVLSGQHGMYGPSRFDEVLKQREEIHLTETQADSLVRGLAQLDSIRYQIIKRYPDGTYWSSTFEGEKLSKILSPLQLNQVLEARYKLKARTKAIKDWEKLEENGLAKGLDRKTAESEFYEYELNYLIASERHEMLKTPENAYQKRLAESKRPAKLQELKDFESGKAAALQVKKQFAW